MNTLLTLARKELKDGLRNRWVLAIAILLAAFALTLAFLGSAPAGETKANALAITVVSLATLNIYLIPLIALLLSYDAIVGEIERGLRAATDLLASGGVLAVITFHGLEDALVKRFIRACEGAPLPAEIPSAHDRVNPLLRLVPPVIKPSAGEVADNPRSRSARLRKAVKI